MLTHRFRLITVLIFVLLQACSGPGKGGRGLPGSTDGEGGNGSGEGINDPVESVGVIIEKNGCSLSSPIKIVALDYDFREFGNTPISVPDYEVVDREPKGYTIEFGDLFVEQANIVIRASLGSCGDIYAPLHSLSNNNDTITVSHKSNYVLEKLFANIDSNAELNELLPCASSVNDCPNQYLAKASLLAQISKTAQQYEIDIQNNASLTEASTLLVARLCRCLAESTFLAQSCYPATAWLY